METKRKAKGSWGVRFFIVVLGITLGFLFYWLLNFVESDIGKIDGPDWGTIRGEFVSREVDDNQQQLQKEIRQLNRKIETLEEQQEILGNGISSLQKTMSQLLSFQQQYIEKGQEFPAENMRTLQESQTAFLEHQKQDQEYTKEMSVLIQRRQKNEDALSAVSEKIEALEADARGKYGPLQKKYELKVAVLKLSFLVPVFLATAFFFIKFRGGAYWPLVWAAFVASFIKIALVINEEFESEYLKYVAILVVLGIVLRMLIYLIKMIVAPKKDLLIKQYQQFYDKHLCPVCTKPIKAGPLRYAGWKKKTTVLAPQGTEIDKQQPYNCPSCGTNLYDKCGSCGNIRHILLPYCEHCGVEK